MYIVCVDIDQIYMTYSLKFDKMFLHTYIVSHVMMIIDIN